jgi:CubicO group peptidase (beta-lactamase class C family)
LPAQPRDEGKALAEFCRNFPDGTEIAIGISENGVRQQLGFTKMGGRLEPSANATRPFELGSITKVFTAVLVAHAIREGRFTPETDIRSFYAFPLGYRSPGTITVGQLCTHTSGFKHDYPNFTPHLKGPRYAGPFPVLDRDGLHGLLKKRRSLVSPPGSRLSYSNFGYAVLGDILSRTAGKSYDQLLREVITEPLHLQATTLAITEGLVPGRNAAGRVVRNSEGSAYDPVAHVKSSVADMLTLWSIFS